NKGGASTPCVFQSSIGAQGAARADGPPLRGPLPTQRGTLFAPRATPHRRPKPRNGVVWPLLHAKRPRHVRTLRRRKAESLHFLLAPRLGRFRRRDGRGAGIWRLGPVSRPT